MKPVGKASPSPKERAGCGRLAGALLLGSAVSALILSFGFAIVLGGGLRIFVIFLPIYIVVLPVAGLLGLPAYAFAVSTGRAGWWSAALAGAVIALLVPLLSELPLALQGEGSAIADFICFAGAGAAGGLVFWRTVTSTGDQSGAN